MPSRTEKKVAEEIFDREYKLKLAELYRSEGRSRVESDMILPDYKEEAHRIVRGGAKARVNQKNISFQGQNLILEIEGAVGFDILYQSDRRGEKGIYSSFMAWENFSHTFKIPFPREEADPEQMIAQVELSCENVSAKLFGPRKISARCDVKILVDLKCNRRMELFCDRFPEDIKTKNGNLNVAKLVLCHSFEETFTETISLPKEYLAISEICEMGASLFSHNVIAEDGGVSFGVLCDLDCCYLSEGEEDLVSFYQPIEFQKRIGLPEAANGQFAKVCLVPNFLKAVPDINEDGENRNILFEIGYSCEVMLFSNEESSIVCDAFSLETELDLEMREEAVEEILGLRDFHLSVKDEFEHEETELFRIEAIRSHCDFKNCYLEDGKIFLEGKLQCSFLGESSEGDFRNMEHSYDFTTHLPAAEFSIQREEECRIEIEGGARAVDLVPDGKKVLIRFDLCGSISVYKKQRARIVNEIKRGEKRKKDVCGILYIFPEEGESLWALSKKYGLSPEAIAEENQLAEESLPSVIRITR